MLLTISTTYEPATDLGYLLHKNPNRCQSFDLSFGSVHIFYPVAEESNCTVAVLLDIDPVGMVRGRKKHKSNLPLEQYINDRPYVASSFLSVAISQVLGSALRGECKERPELVDKVMPLTVKLAVLPSRGGEQIMHRLFTPLGYEVNSKRHSLDKKFPEWGESSYYSVVLKKETVISQLLTHLYVLMPVLDNQKHYYIGRDEVEKLLRRGKGWLGEHPEKEMIARRYLKYQTSLAKEAIARLAEDTCPDVLEDDVNDESFEVDIEKQINLNEERLGTVLSILKSSACRSVIDLGCGEGRLLKILLKDNQFERIEGMDVSIRSLEIAHKKLHLDNSPLKQRERIKLIHGSLMYRDKRFSGFDAATIIEVIEHLDQPRLAAFERVVFECARPKLVVLSTPNREYNVIWDNLQADKLRHGDHRFEWTRREFQEWSEKISRKYDYKVRFLSAGPERPEIGCPTQIAVFTRMTDFKIQS
jgi:3' terminal RNA ribose 2'-O-methyltransferase Hen1